jgi:hypothetical protein
VLSIERSWRPSFQPSRRLLGRKVLPFLVNKDNVQEVKDVLAAFK